MTWATMWAGRLQLAERPGGKFDDVSHATTLVRAMALEGQESSPPLTVTEVRARMDDILGLMRRLVPMRFTEKPDRNGYYEIIDNNTSLEAFATEVVRVSWQLRAEKQGSDTEVDLESQLSGALTRANAHSLTGERWHAPPPAAYAWSTRTGTPSTLVVTGAEGPLTVYRGIPVGVNPRWGCPVEGYGGYRVRFLDSNGLERTGYPALLATTGWELHNSLVRVTADADGLHVESHNGTAWAEKLWKITVASQVLAAPEQVVVIRNDYEAGTVRLLWSRSPAPGRVQLDLTVRRGARWVEGHLQTQPGGVTLTVGLVTPETTTAPASSGYITATGDDADGNRFLLGSAGAFTPNTGASSISASSAAAMHFMVGSVVGGGSAPSGDQAANHMARYLGAAAENVRAVRR